MDRHTAGDLDLYTCRYKSRLFILSLVDEGENIDVIFLSFNSKQTEATVRNLTIISFLPQNKVSQQVNNKANTQQQQQQQQGNHCNAGRNAKRNKNKRAAKRRKFMEKLIQKSV